MSDIRNDRPQDNTTPTPQRCFKGPDLTVVCSVLIIATAVTIVYFVPGKDSRICCNFNPEQNLTRMLLALENQIEDRRRHLEKEKERKTDGKIPVCRHGWIRYGDKCYYFSKDKHSWSTSLLKCRDEGGYLAEINNDDENRFIREQAILLSSFLWLGGSDQLEESDWIWVTSMTHFSTGLYTDWHVGQPNNAGRGEHCLHLYTEYNYHWNDSPCSVLMRYVCESDFSVS